MIRHKMKRIQTKLNRTGIYDVCKISLPCFYVKRYILDHDINRLDYLYKDVRSQ